MARQSAPRLSTIGDAHYQDEPVGARIGLSGAGLHAELTGDHLHPPMVTDREIWADGTRWAEGAAAHSLDVARFAELRPGERILDIGCGPCGPARLWVDRFDVRVVAVTDAGSHAETGRRLNRQRDHWAERITVYHVDCQDPLPEVGFDAAISLNMAYQVPNHESMFRRVFEALAPGGRFVLDDWMLTGLETTTDVADLRRHFGYDTFLRTPTVEISLCAAGFPPAERMQDMGAVGRELLSAHFEPVMREYFAPRLAAIWPGTPDDNPGQAAYGKLLVRDFVDAVNVTIHLYRAHKLTYRRLLVRKPAELGSPCR